MICIRCKKEIADESIYCLHCGKKQVKTEKPKALRRPNGTGTVIKHTSGKRRRKVWRASLRGKEIGYFETREEAYQALDKIISKGISSTYNQTLQETFEKFVELKKDQLSKEGLENYYKGFKYLEPYKDIPMTKIRTEHFQKAIERAKDLGVGSSIWLKIRNIGSLLCQYTMANDLLDKNYAMLVIMPKDENKTERPGFTREQLETMWELADADDGIKAILIMCYTGFRINEFLDIEKSMVDLESQTIKAPGSKTEAGRDRIITLPQRIMPLIQYFINKDDAPYLYPSPTGRRYQARNFRERIFKETLEKYNLNADGKLTPHSCRHTYAWLCVTANVEQKAAKDLLGHSKFETTANIYANMTQKDIEYLKKETNKIK